MTEILTKDLQALDSPKTALRKRGRPKGRKNNKTLVKEAAKEKMHEIFAEELTELKSHAEEVVQRTIYKNIPGVMEKMAEQALDGQFSQQKEFLKRVSPETKAIDPDKALGGLQININVAEFTRAGNDPAQSAIDASHSVVTIEKEEIDEIHNES